MISGPWFQTPATSHATTLSISWTKSLLRIEGKPHIFLAKS
uniref:Uncharacterized protein n=1 Tax=Physcomitrium patens TaxID=3218 RepID=A0A7I4AD91_PHYPA